MYDLALMARTARRRWLVLVACALVTFAALVGWAQARPSRFEVSNLVVLPSRSALEDTGLDRLDIDAALGSSDELVILETGRSSSFRAEAAERANARIAPGSDDLFVRQVQGPPGSRIESGRPIARVTAAAEDAREARALSAAAASLLAEEISRDIEMLAERAPARLRPVVRRNGAVVATHDDVRREGRSSLALSIAAAGFLAIVVTLTVLVLLTWREPSDTGEVGRT